MTNGIRLPRCLVLLASHNGAEYIRQQIESILAQREVTVEILIGDDGSTDTTLEIVENLNTAGNIQVLRPEVGSGSAAQNFARLFREADITDFDYVALSDQDDIWLLDKLQRATIALASGKAGGYSCSVTACWPDGRESVFRQSARLRDADFLFEGAGQGCSFVVTAALFASVQKVFRMRPELTKSLIYHDWAVYALARVQEVPWIFEREPFIVYRQHANNDTGARHSMAGVSRRLRLFRSGRYSVQVMAITRLCLEVAPERPLPQRWMKLNVAPSGLWRRQAKALFCFRHGRRRQLDRVLTAFAALAGWV